MPFKPAGFFDVHLLHANTQAWDIFLLCRTQWRRSQDGLYDSLDYNAVVSVIHMHDCDPLETLQRVQLIESGAKTKFSEHRSKLENSRHA